MTKQYRRFAVSCTACVEGDRESCVGPECQCAQSNHSLCQAVAKRKAPDREIERDLMDADRRLAEARADLDDIVVRAREAGWSWSRIGHSLGVTKQSAWQRFAHLSA